MWPQEQYMNKVHNYKYYDNITGKMRRKINMKY